MTTNVINDLKMAKISLAKVADVEKLQADAQELISDYRTSVKVKEEVQDALASIESAPDYKVTPGMVKEVDNLINAQGQLIVHGNKVSVAGTEAFGLTMLPSEWRATRSVALKELLSESYKNIKRWANQLSENFQRRWVELMTSTEVLENRLESLDGTLNVIGSVRPGAGKVELNELISKTISKNGKVFTKDIGRNLQSEINYILSCIKVWEMEQIKFKNSIIRYFGNPRNTDITEINREVPKLFDQKGNIDTNEGMLLGKTTKPMLDGYFFEGVQLDPKWVQNFKRNDADNQTLYADSLALTGYAVIANKETRVTKTQVELMELSEIYVARDLIETIISKLKDMNTESDPVNFNPDDIKDVLATLKATDGGDARAYQYGVVTADYQFDVNSFKTGVSNMLTVLSSHLITLVNIHLESYDVES